MQKIKILSRKYNTARDQHEATLVADENGTITVFSPPGVRYYDYRKAAWFAAPDGLLELYYTARWYNVWHICEQTSNQSMIYANICTPAVLQADTLTWVDLDLDLRVNLDGTIDLLDEMEFAQNIRLLGYPQWLVDRAWAACDEVMNLFESGELLLEHQRQVALYQRIKERFSGQ